MNLVFNYFNTVILEKKDYKQTYKEKIKKTLKKHSSA